MVSTNKLKAIIVEREMTGEQVAKELGISSKTFYSKMKTCDFTLSQTNKMIQLLKIENPSEVFFGQNNGTA